jgi:diamine N-acetyltransferase
VIRPATLDDVAALAALAQRTWEDAFGPSLEPDDVAAELEETRSEAYFVEALGAQTILVAEQAGELVGYAQFGDVDFRGIDVRPGDQALHRVYVETELQGRGWGRMLVEAALAHPRLTHAGRIYLQVWERNEPAIKLYESVGFRTVGTTTFTIGGTVAEDLVMVLDRTLTRRG